MASTSASRRTASTPVVQTFSPDEILEEIWEEIFLRLDAAADLIRVSATCSSFSRIVFARQFLRRFGSLHSPPVLGFVRYGCRDLLPAEPPHRSAPQAHALVQAADFTFSFLPDPHAWRTSNAHNGRVLLSRRISPKISNWDLIVSDPLHRQYVKIPRIPDDLIAASTADSCNAPRVLPILAPAAEKDGEESFRVISIVQLQPEDKFMGFFFSSCNQTWRGIISTTETTCVPNGSIEYNPYYAHGCFYWMVFPMGYSLVLDTSEMKFSIIDLPPHDFESSCAIVEAVDGRLGFLTVGDGTVDMYCKDRQSNGVGAQEWQHNKVISLPMDFGIDYTWTIVGTAGHYVAFCASYEYEMEDYEYEMQDHEYFVLDIKTLLVEKFCTSNNDKICGFLYVRFPPPLAPPSI